MRKSFASNIAIVALLLISQAGGFATAQSQGEQEVQSQGEQEAQSQGEQEVQSQGEQEAQSQGEQEVQSQDSTAAADDPVAATSAPDLADVAAAAAAEREAAEAAAQARLEALLDELEQRERAIEDLQSEFGVYHPALLEAYFDLGALHQALEDHESAAASYNDALQLSRINSGLYSEQQLPLIDALIDSRSRLQDWQRVDDLQHLRFHMSSRLYGAADTPLLVAAAEFGDWRLRLLRENLLQLNGNGQMNLAENLSLFYDRVLLDMENQQQAVNPQALLNLLYGKTRADLSLARAVARTPYTAFSGTAQPYILQTRCRNVTNAAGQLVRQCSQVRVENPRYRQSQREAKRFALGRYTREIASSIERLQRIRDTGEGLSSADREGIQARIAELQTESEQLLRSARLSVF